MKTKKQKKPCDKKTWSQIALDKQCNIIIDTDDVQVMSADGALFKMNKKTRQGKLLFYYRLPTFPSSKEKQHKMKLRATVEVRLPLEAMTTIAGYITKHYEAIHNQTLADTFTESERSNPPSMFA